MKKILLIEDEEGLREILKEKLKTWSYEVLIAKDGQEGIDVIQRHSVDIVITDFRMPKMNGVEVVRYIKLYNPAIRTVLITGDVAIVWTIAKAAGADEILPKPIEFERLRKILRHLIINS